MSEEGKPEKFELTNKVLESVLPPENWPIQFGSFLFKVTYRNVGQKRFSAELFALFLAEKEGGEPFAVLPDGTRMTMAEFEAYRRKNAPMAKEKDRNPKNVTLDVKSGVFTPQGKFLK